MEKLPMCRLCLADNVSMYVVINQDLHELYERLTDIPFLTEDRRPILACFICCAQLKKCYRLLTKCLDAEERFARIMNAGYAPKPLINQDHLEFHGIVKAPIQIINIFDVSQTGTMLVKEKLLTDFQRLEDIIQPKEEHQSDDDLEVKNLYDNYLDIEYPPHFQQDSEERKVHRPLTEFKTEVEEEQVAVNKRKAKKTNRARVATKLDTGSRKLEDTITPQIKKADLNIIQYTQNRTSFPLINIKPRVQNSIHNKTNCSTNNNQDFKPFKSDTSHRRFKKKSNLTKHIAKHTGEKHYKCDVCQRSFSLKGNLRKHILTHTGEKPYKCEVCHRSYSQNHNLTKHINAKHW